MKHERCPNKVNFDEVMSEVKSEVKSEVRSEVKFLREVPHDMTSEKCFMCHVK